MSEMITPKEVDSIQELVKQLEGVENNAFTIRVLAELFELIAKDHPEAFDQLTIISGVLEEVRSLAWARMEEMQKLPEEEHHYLFNGEIAAQEAFMGILVQAFSTTSDMTTAQRVAFVTAKAEEHALVAEQHCAPLYKLREVMEIADPAVITLNIE